MYVNEIFNWGRGERQEDDLSEGVSQVVNSLIVVKLSLFRQMLTAGRGLSGPSIRCLTPISHFQFSGDEKNSPPLWF